MKLSRSQSALALVLLFSGCSSSYTYRWNGKSYPRHDYLAGKADAERDLDREVLAIEIGGVPLRWCSESNVRFWSFAIGSVRMSRTLLSVARYCWTEDDSRGYRRADTVPPNKSLERTAPRCVVDGVIYIWTVGECRSGADRRRRSALDR